MNIKSINQKGLDTGSSRYYFKSMKEEEKKKKKKGILLLILLLFFTFFNTTLSYNYWDGNINPINTNNLNIGVGTTLTVYENITPADGYTLVPQGVFMGEHDVDEMLFSYTVYLNKEGFLSVDLLEILIDSNPDIYNLIDFDIYTTEPNEVSVTTLTTLLTTPNINEEYVTEVFIRVRLNMPENEEQYNYVKNAAISFSLQFEASELEEEA